MVKRNKPTWIFGAQIGFVVFQDECFEGAFIIDQRGDYIAVARSHAVFENDQVTRDNVVADHGIAPNFEGESAWSGLDADGFDVDGDAALGFLTAVFGQTGRNGTEERDVDHATAHSLQGRDYAQSASSAVGLGQNTLFAERANMMNRGGHAAETEVLGDVAQCGGQTVELLIFLDKIEDLGLSFG